MSLLLESGLTDEQREACARNDAALIASMFPLEGGFTEAELQAGDVERLRRQKEREAECLRIAHELDLQEMRRAGL